MATTRDSQRQRAYDAENKVQARWEKGLPGIEGLPTPEQCKAFLLEVLTRPRVLERFGRREVQAVLRKLKVVDWPRATGARANSYTGRIRVSSSLTIRNRMILLHEVAHILTPRAAHGRAWARAYLDLVTMVLGAEPARELRAGFVKQGVRYRKVTEAQRAAGRALAAKAQGNTAGLERWREEQRQKREALEQQGMVKVGKHWMYPARPARTEYELPE